MRRTLETMGHQVVGVGDFGESALVTALARRPDLVLMDIRLAGNINGVPVARRLWEEAA